MTTEIMTSQAMIDSVLKSPSKRHSLLFTYCGMRPSLAALKPTLGWLDRYLSKYPTCPAFLRGKYKLQVTESSNYPIMVKDDQYNVIKGELSWVVREDKAFIVLENVLGIYTPNLTIRSVRPLDPFLNPEYHVDAMVFLCVKQPRKDRDPHYGLDYFDVPKNEEGIIDFAPFYRLDFEYRFNQD